MIEIKEVVGKRLAEGSLPDIDSDFPTNKRQDIIKYMAERFGKENVVVVGTVSALQLKGVIKEFDRLHDNNVPMANLVTSTIDGVKDRKVVDLYNRAAIEPKLKHYMQQNSDAFNMLPSILGAQKSKSIHACAVIITPKALSTQEWMPVREQDGQLISEWTGGELDEAGFLKNDVLGLLQLDKFADILDLAKENGKEIPDIYNLPHNDEVYRYFSNGWNGDVFQMGTDSLSAYTKLLQPENFNDLAAVVSLYRPGPMENGIHLDYAKRKNEGAAITSLWGSAEETKDTYGLIVYQEQVMKICQNAGGLTENEADDVRRAMGKKKADVLAAWETRMMKGFMGNGATEREAQELWDTLLKFAGYSFNLSHAAAYGQTGYISQYLKVMFPTEYWTVAMKYADDPKKLKFLSEIFSSKEIKVEPPHINGSGIDMQSDIEKKTIFWGISSIKGIGEDTAAQIVKEREDNGDYEGFDDFYKRTKFTGSKVKKTAYEALIAVGAFDELDNIGEPVERLDLIRHYRTTYKVKIAKASLARDPYSREEAINDWFWKLRQKELTGLAFIDYENLLGRYDIKGRYCKIGEARQRAQQKVDRTFGGYVVEVKVGRTKKGEYARLTIEHNYNLFKVIMWPEQFEPVAPLIKGCEKGLILFRADLAYDEKYARANQFVVNSDEIMILK